MLVFRARDRDCGRRAGARFDNNLRDLHVQDLFVPRYDRSFVAHLPGNPSQQHPAVREPDHVWLFVEPRISIRKKAGCGFGDRTAYGLFHAELPAKLRRDLRRFNR